MLCHVLLHFYWRPLIFKKGSSAVEYDGPEIIGTDMHVWVLLAIRNKARGRYFLSDQKLIDDPKTGNT
jgi:hypothetical protein